MVSPEGRWNGVFLFCGTRVGTEENVESRGVLKSSFLNAGECEVDTDQMLLYVAVIEARNSTGER
jgi:hypothetical protein